MARDKRPTRSHREIPENIEGLQGEVSKQKQSGTLVVYYDLSILRDWSLLSRSILRARSILRGFLSV